MQQFYLSFKRLRFEEAKRSYYGIFITRDDTLKFLTKYLFTHYHEVICDYWQVHELIPPEYDENKDDKLFKKFHLKICEQLAEIILIQGGFCIADNYEIRCGLYSPNPDDIDEFLGMKVEKPIRLLLTAKEFKKFGAKLGSGRIDSESIPFLDDSKYLTVYNVSSEFLDKIITGRVGPKFGKLNRRNNDRDEFDGYSNQVCYLSPKSTS